MKELVPMANANVNQVTKGAEKTEWIIRENITEDELGRLPAKLVDKEVFAILHLIRKYEIEGFNKGIIFGKEKAKEISDKQIEILERKIGIATEENERLAIALDNIYKK